MTGLRILPHCLSFSDNRSFSRSVQSRHMLSEGKVKLNEETKLTVSWKIGEPSPLSSPVGPLSESPESGSYIGNLSGNTDESMKCSMETLSSGYDHLSRYVY